MTIERFLDVLCVTIISANKESKILSGRDVNFFDFLEKNNKLHLASSLMEKTKEDFFLAHNKNMESASDDEISKFLISNKRRNFRILNELVVNLCECYYSNKKALNSLGLPENPPFPEGNIINDLDLSLLEVVFDRGKIYRDF